MEFGLGFMLLLLAVGGFAAYQGDRVGMLVGRRRLSIFGLRPRYTSRIITVFTGVFIVLITLTSLIILSSNVRQALFGMEQLKGTVTALSTDVANKNNELVNLEAQRRKLSQTNASLTEKNQQLQSQNTKLAAEKDKLAKGTAALQAEQKRLEADRQALLSQLSELRRAGAYYFDQANRLQQVNIDLRQANFVYHALDVVTSRVIDARQSEEALRQELRQLVAEAGQQVLRRGAGDQKSGIGVRIDRVVTGQNNQLFPVSADTVIDLAVDAIKSDQNLQSVIVQLVALTNAAQNEPVLADFNLIRNVIIYAAGDVVSRHTFDGRLPASQLFEELIMWMQADIRTTASKQGLMPQDDGTFGGVSPQQAYALVDQIIAQQRPVEVTAYAGQDCWTRGPLILGFRL